jgi:hypothetical protein
MYHWLRTTHVPIDQIVHLVAAHTHYPWSTGNLMLLPLLQIPIFKGRALTGCLIHCLCAARVPIGRECVCLLLLSLAYRITVVTRCSRHDGRPYCNARFREFNCTVRVILTNRWSMVIRRRAKYRRSCTTFYPIAEVILAVFDCSTIADTESSLSFDL